MGINKLLVSHIVAIVIVSLGLDLGLSNSHLLLRDRHDILSTSMQSHHEELVSHNDLLAQTPDRKPAKTNNDNEASYIEDFVSSKVLDLMYKDFKNKSSETAEAILAESERLRMSPIFLMAVIQNESTFRPDIVGGHGEIGLMQIKPDTAKWICQKAGLEWRGRSALFKPSYNIKVGAAYLNMLRKKYDKNQNLYLTAYNMGASKLNKRIARRQRRPKQYAGRVMGFYHKFFLAFLESASSAEVRVALK